MPPSVCGGAVDTEDSCMRLTFGGGGVGWWWWWWSRPKGELGIGNNDAVVVYDTVNIFSSARCWWMFNVRRTPQLLRLVGGDGGRVLKPAHRSELWVRAQVYGHTNVAVMNGGLPKWIRDGRPLESGPVPSPTVRVLSPSVLLLLAHGQSACQVHRLTNVCPSSTRNSTPCTTRPWFATMRIWRAIWTPRASRWWTPVPPNASSVAVHHREPFF